MHSILQRRNFEFCTFVLKVCKTKNHSPSNTEYYFQILQKYSFYISRRCVLSEKMHSHSCKIVPNIISSTKGVVLCDMYILFRDYSLENFDKIIREYVKVFSKEQSCREFLLSLPQ